MAKIRAITVTKISFLLAFLLGTLITSHADQGFLQWGNNLAGSIRSPIFGPDPANPYSSLTGQPTNINSIPAIPPGGTIYPGPLLQGSSYTFAVFAGPTSATSNTLTLIGSTTFRTASANI